MRKITMMISAALLAGLVAATPPTLRAQQGPDVVAIADSLSRMVHRASITGDMELLQSARTLARRALTAEPGHPLLSHHLAETFYRESTALMETDEDRAQALLEEAQEVLDVVVEGDAPAETHALRASVIGMRITGMIKGMTLGPRAEAALDRAKELDPGHPLVWLSSGISTLHKPGFMGGGADAAIEELERGIELLETHEPVRGHARGGGAELWAWVGIAHMRANRPAEARAAFERALELEPEFGWVRHVLLPEARQARGAGSRSSTESPTRMAPSSRMMP